MEKTLRIELLEKKSQLEQTRDQLKKEFVGFDNLIDSMIDKISSWYNFSHMQQQPRVINIWGAQDSGKYSLAKRLIHLLGFSKETNCTSILDEEPEAASFITVIKDFQFPNSEEMNLKLHQKVWSVISKADRYEKQPLIFVLGNINSIYLNTSGSAITSSISADKLKELMQLYFTREQIAVLGEHHLIIPSLTSEEVNKLISKRISVIHDQFLKTYGIPFNFDLSVPVFVFRQFFQTRNQSELSVTSLIQKYVLNFTNEVLTEAAIQNIIFESIQVREEAGLMIADYIRDGRTVYQFKYQFIKMKLEEVRPQQKAQEINLNKRVLKSTPKMNEVRLSA